MSNRNDYRRFRNTTATLSPYSYYSSAEFRLVASTPRLTHRSLKITDRREVEVSERKGGQDSPSFFFVPPKPAETTKKWSSETITEIEETYE